MKANLPPSNPHLPTSTFQPPTSNLHLPTFTLHLPSSTLHLPTSNLQLPPSTLLILLVALLLIGLWLLILSRRRRVRGGLPAGEVVYSDSRAWQPVARPLISRRYGLIGKPDYLVEVARGQAPVPVEVKTGRRPSQPYPGHIMQLAAYCLLVEEQWQTAPPYGLIHYGEDATFRIDYTPALRTELLAVLAEMRAASAAPDVTRSHQEPARCRRCGVAHACDARL